jgi:hypothetical protein
MVAAVGATIGPVHEAPFHLMIVLFSPTAQASDVETENTDSNLPDPVGGVSAGSTVAESQPAPSHL